MLPTEIYGPQPWDRTEDLTGNGVTVSPWKLSRLGTWHAFFTVPGTDIRPEAIFEDRSDAWWWKVQYPFSDPFEDFDNESCFNRTVRFERELILAECMSVVEKRAIAAGAAWGTQIERQKRLAAVTDILNRSPHQSELEGEFWSLAHHPADENLITPSSHYATEDEREETRKLWKQIESYKRNPHVVVRDFVMVPFDPDDEAFDGYEEQVFALAADPKPTKPDTSEDEAIRQLLAEFDAHATDMKAA